MWKKLLNITVIIIGLVSGIMTIISFIWLVLDIKIEPISLVIDFNVPLNASGIISSVAIFFCCMLFLRKEKIRNKKRQEEILSHYNRALSIVQRWFLVNLQNINSIDDKQTLVSEVTEQIKRFFKEIYKKTISVHIKIIRGTQNEDYYAQTFCSTDSFTVAHDSREPLKENTAFNSLFETGKVYFHYSTKHKTMPNYYITSDHRWFQKYSSLLVLPIKGVRENGEEIIGFLWLDSIDPRTFDKETIKLMIPLLNTAVAYLYLVLKV